MCEQTPLEYKDGDIVWVKMRSFWWPGEVKSWESVPDELATKKDKTIAFVKFFEEDCYEVIKNLDNIYLYNCKRKDEFIRKGLGLYRKKENTFMKKFPGDVSAAEQKTGGDPDIVNSPKFAEEKPVKIKPILFGKPKPSIKKRQTISNFSSQTSSLSSSLSSRKSLPVISHPRFLGNDDFEVRELIQPEVESSEPPVLYTCPSCGFKSSRLGVIESHHKSHIQGVYSSFISSGKKGKKSLTKRVKKYRKSFTDNLEDDTEDFWTDDNNKSEDDDDLKVKKIRKTPKKKLSTPKKKSSHEFTDEETPKKRKSKKLLEIEEDENDKSSEDVSKPKKRRRTLKPKADVNKEKILDTSRVLLADWEDNDSEDEEISKINETVKSTDEDKKVGDTIEKSCFDFDEDDVESSGNIVIEKIQRPVENSKAKSPEKSSKSVKNLEIEDTQLNSVPNNKEDPVKSPESKTLANSDKCNNDSLLNDDDKDGPKVQEEKNLEEISEKSTEDEKSEETIVKSDEVRVTRSSRKPKSLKDEVNVEVTEEMENEDGSSKVKKSQKNSKLDGEVVEVENKKPENPTFEEFEALMQATAAPEVPDVPDVPENLKEQQNFHFTKIKKIPDKGDPPRNQTQSSSTSEAATKHTNPKKRFVKAFEDLELAEKRKIEKKEETEKDKKSEKKTSTSSGNDFLGVRTRESSRIKIETATSADKEEEVVELKVLKLKSQLMTKLTEVQNEDDKQQIVPKYKKFNLKKSTPRSLKKDKTEEKKKVNTRSLVKLSIISNTNEEKQKNAETSNISSYISSVKKLDREVPEMPEIIDTTNSTPNNQERVRKKIEIIPKNHGELNIKVTKVLENDDAKGKYLYSKRQGRYSLKFRGRHSYFDSTTTEQKDTSQKVPECSQAIVPTVEEIEFPKTSIQRNVIKSTRNSFCEDTRKIIDIKKDKTDAVPSTSAEHNNDQTLPEPILCKIDIKNVTLDAVAEKIVQNNEPVATKTIPNEVTNKLQEKSTTEELGDKQEKIEDNDSGEIADDQESSSQDELSQNVNSAEVVGAKKSNKKRRYYRGSRRKRYTKKSKAKDDKNESTNTEEEEEDEEADIDHVEKKVDPDKNITSSNESKTESSSVVSVKKDNEAKENVEDEIDVTTVTPNKNTSTKRFFKNAQRFEGFNNYKSAEEKDGDCSTENKNRNVKLDENELNTESEITKPSLDSTAENSHEIQNTDEIIIEQSVETTNDSEKLISEKLVCDENKKQEDNEKSKLEDKITSNSEVAIDNDFKPEEITDKINNSDNFEESSKVRSEQSFVNDVAKEIAITEDIGDKIKTDQVKNQELSDDSVGKEKRSIVEAEKVLASVFVTTSEKDELSALSTLAAVSELSPPLEEQATFEKIKSIDANLKVVPQTDFENVQVEFVNTPESKPVTLTNFSVDFTELKESDNKDSSKSKASIESSNTEIPPEEVPFVDISTEKNKDSSFQVQTEIEDDETMTSSKLLEILTDNIKGNTQSESTVSLSPTDSSLTKTQVLKSKPTHSKETSKFIIKTTLNEDELAARKKQAITGKEISQSSVVLNTSTNTNQVKEQTLRPKNAKVILKTSIGEMESAIKKKQPITKITKPTILNEKLMKPVGLSDTVSVQTISSKRVYEDIEDIDTFIIQKPAKKIALDSGVISDSLSPSTSNKRLSVTPRNRGKARILQQTIITPAGDVIQPNVTQAQTEESIFDINSMPIVLGDQILTPDNIEDMPVVISESTVPSKIIKQPIAPQPKLLNKTPSQKNVLKTYSVGQPFIKNKKPQQVSRILNKNSPLPVQSNKQEKFIIIPSNATGTSKPNVGKKFVKQTKPSSVILPTSTDVSEPVGNKIMIVTNQQGQQQRVLLTPAQQKLLGYQSPGTKLTKAALKGGIMAKTTKNIKASPTQNLVFSSKSSNIPSNQCLVTTAGQIILPMNQTNQRKVDSVKYGKKVTVESPKVTLNDTLRNSNAISKTVVIKNHQGQIVKKIQGTDDALLEKQVQEQVKAIKASSSFNALKAQNKIDTTPKSAKTPMKRSYVKKTGDVLQKQSVNLVQEAPPPLTPLSQSTKNESHIPQKEVQPEEKNKEQQRPLNQLIIQDALGNQTTITEGQIFALPSETVDGQAQSYMLVTLDETGNLTPLDNEALLSLDRNFGIGGTDLNNMVLQVDDQNVKADPVPENSINAPEIQKVELPKHEQLIPSVQTSHEENISLAVTETTNSVNISPNTDSEENPTITCSVSDGSNQQLLISGDPISTQKFIESLTEGNADLANLLASAEGNILIQTDGQQILINTDSSNPLLLPVNAENVAMEVSESDGNPIFATQTNKSQDILAAALADTDVFQQEQPVSHSKPPQAQLSPSNTLFPMNVGNVLETSLTLSSPIMTPLEVPSSNSKKIADENVLSTEVPKNVDLPITITDPNISQTVAQQQAATLMAAELQSNIDLPLTIGEQAMSVSSSEMNSSSFVYSLPTLDDSVEINQKTYGSSISMPLLNEEADTTSSKSNHQIEDSVVFSNSEEVVKEVEVEDSNVDNGKGEKNKRSHSPVTSSFISSIDGGLCTLGGAMCSSLSEPPPDMFDLSSAFLTVEESKKDESNVPELNTKDNEVEQNLSTENSMSNIELSQEVDLNVETDELKENNVLNGNSVLNLRSMTPNVDENSSEIPLQPPIVAQFSEVDDQQIETLNAESGRSEPDSDTLTGNQNSVPLTTENSSNVNSTKRKADDDYEIAMHKKPRID